MWNQALWLQTGHDTAWGASRRHESSQGMSVLWHRLREGFQCSALAENPLCWKLCPQHCSQARGDEPSNTHSLATWRYAAFLLDAVIGHLHYHPQEIVPNWWAALANFWCELSSKEKRGMTGATNLAKPKNSLSPHPSYPSCSSFVCLSHPGIDYLVQPAPLAGLGEGSSSSVQWRHSGALQFGTKAFHSQEGNDTRQEENNWSDQSSSIW